ncbi:MAG: TrmB family transcriptional regulator sugar-binding domain-containing protein [Candidatus Hodarchaeales archaeon]
MNDSRFLTAQNDLNETLDEIERKIRSFKSLDSPLVDWQLHALLRRLGLNKYEILAYVALVLRGPQTIAEITGKVSRTGIPQPRAYDTMGSLIQYGLVEEGKRGKTKVFRAIPPDEGLVNLMNFFIFAKEQALNILKTQMQIEEPSYGGIWEIKSQYNIIQRAKRIISLAEKEILLVADIEVVSKILPALLDIKKKKHIIISIVMKFEGEKNIEMIFDWFSHMKIRSRRAFSMPYLIIDRKYALLWQKKSFQVTLPQNAVGQIIENEEIIETIIDHFFFTNWKTAKILTDDLDKDLIRTYPLSLCNIATCIDEVELLLRRNLDPEVTVEGYRTGYSEKVCISGVAVRTESNWDNGIFSIYIKDSQNKTWTVGGMLASFEDISADKIVVKPKKIE